jgi:hypothetical protein
MLTLVKNVKNEAVVKYIAIWFILLTVLRVLYIGLTHG